MSHREPPLYSTDNILFSWRPKRSRATAKDRWFDGVAFSYEEEIGSLYEQQRTRSKRKFLFCYDVSPVYLIVIHLPIPVHVQDTAHSKDLSIFINTFLENCAEGVISKYKDDNSEALPLDKVELTELFRLCLKSSGKPVPDTVKSNPNRSISDLDRDFRR